MSNLHHNTRPNLAATPEHYNRSEWHLTGKQLEQQHNTYRDLCCAQQNAAAATKSQPQSEHTHCNAQTMLRRQACNGQAETLAEGALTDRGTTPLPAPYISSRALQVATAMTVGKALHYFYTDIPSLMQVHDLQRWAANGFLLPC